MYSLTLLLVDNSPKPAGPNEEGNSKTLSCEQKAALVMTVFLASLGIVLALSLILTNSGVDMGHLNVLKELGETGKILGGVVGGIAGGAFLLDLFMLLIMQAKFINRLQKALDRLHERLGEDDRRSRGLIQELRICGGRIENLEARLEETEGLVRRIEHEKGDTIDGQGVALEAYEMEVHRLQVEIERLKDDLGRQDRVHATQVESMNHAVDEQVGQLRREHQVQVEDLQRRIAGLIKEIEGYRAREGAGVEELRGRFEAQLGVVQRENAAALEEARKKTQTAEERRLIAEAQLKEVREKHADELESYQAEIRRLGAQINNDYAPEIARLNAEIKKLEQASSEGTAEKGGQGSAEEIERLKGKVKDLEKTVDAREERIQAVKKERNAARQALENERARLIEDCQVQEKEVARLREVEASLKDALEEQKAQFEHRIEELQAASMESSVLHDEHLEKIRKEEHEVRMKEKERLIKTYKEETRKIVQESEAEYKKKVAELEEANRKYLALEGMWNERSVIRMSSTFGEEAKIQIEEEKVRLAEREKALEEAAQEAQEKSEELQQRTRELEERQQNLAKTERENTEKFERETKELEAKRADLEKEIKEAEGKKSERIIQQELEIKAKQKELEESQRKLIEEKEQLADVQGQLAERREEIQKAEEEKAAKLLLLQKLEEEKAKMRASMSETEEALKGTREAHEALTDEVARLREEAEKEREEIRRLQASKASIGETTYTTTTPAEAPTPPAPPPAPAAAPPPPPAAPLFPSTNGDSHATNGHEEKEKDENFNSKILARGQAMRNKKEKEVSTVEMPKLSTRDLQELHIGKESGRFIPEDSMLNKEATAKQREEAFQFLFTYLSEKINPGFVEQAKEEAESEMKYIDGIILSLKVGPLSSTNSTANWSVGGSFMAEPVEFGTQSIFQYAPTGMPLKTFRKSMNDYIYSDESPKHQQRRAEELYAYLTEVYQEVGGSEPSSLPCRAVFELNKKREELQGMLDSEKHKANHHSLYSIDISLPNLDLSTIAAKAAEEGIGETVKRYEESLKPKQRTNSPPRPQSKPAPEPTTPKKDLASGGSWLSGGSWFRGGSPSSSSPAPSTSKQPIRPKEEPQPAQEEKFSSEVKILAAIGGPQNIEMFSVLLETYQSAHKGYLKNLRAYEENLKTGDVETRNEALFAVNKSLTHLLKVSGEVKAYLDDRLKAAWTREDKKNGITPEDLSVLGIHA